MINRNKISGIVKIVFSISTILIILVVIIFISHKDSMDSINSYELDKEDISFETSKVNVGKSKIAKVYDVEKGKEYELDVEDYIKGVVASEMSGSYNLEALKAQAIAARTFYYSKRINNCNKANGFEICNSTHCQVYISNEDYLKKWDSIKAQEYWEKISKAVDDTKDKVLVYNNELVLYPQYFAISWGRTESAIDVFANNIPYLKSTDSKGEEFANKYSSQNKIDFNTFMNIVNSNYSEVNISGDLKNSISILSRTEGGSVKEIKIGDKVILGKDFRLIFGLNSANFTLDYDENNIIINCKGYGLGVGMSQWGANVMAEEGKLCEDILKHYYSGVEIEKVKFE